MHANAKNGLKFAHELGGFVTGMAGWPQFSVPFFGRHLDEGFVLFLLWVKRTRQVKAA